MVFNTNTQQLEEPNAGERERAMGFPTGTTAAPNVPEGQRRRLLGQAMDLNSLNFVLAISLLHQRHLRKSPLGGGVGHYNAP